MLQEYLLTSIIREQNSELLMDVKDKLLMGKLLPEFSYAKAQLAVTKAIPSVQAMELKFGASYKGSTDNADYWYKELKSAYRRFVTEETVKAIAKNPADGEKAMQLAIADMQVDTELRIVDYGLNTQKRYQNYRANKGNNGIRYLSTGEIEIDQSTYGLVKPDFWILGGEEGVGKTWLLAWMANRMDKMMLASGFKRPILFVNTEVDTEELMERFDSLRFSLPYGNLMSGNLTPAEERRFGLGVRSLQSNIVIVDDCYTIQDLERYMVLLNPAVSFVDSVHLLADDYDWKEIASLAMNVKKLTRKHKSPIIGSTHLKAGAGKDEMGSVDSFAYGKGWTRNADVAALLYRTDQMLLNDELGWKFVKVRRGVAGTLIFQPDFEKMDYHFLRRLNPGGGSLQINANANINPPSW